MKYETFEPEFQIRPDLGTSTKLMGYITYISTIMIKYAIKTGLILNYLNRTSFLSFQPE